MGKAIHINMSDEGGDETYELLNEWRFSKRMTWKQLVIQCLVFGMLQENKDVDAIAKYLTKK